MCKCGCNTCETKGPLLTEGKVKSLLSEGLQYHIDKKIPLFETVYRIGSDKHLALIKEARKMYSRNVINLCEDDEALIKTHLGEFALYEQTSTVSKRRAGAELKQKLKGVRSDGFGKYDATIYGLDSDGKRVELKSLNDLNKFDKFELAESESIPLDLPMLNESYDYDEVAQSEFGMDYDQLGSGEKEWVRDEIDNMSMNEIEQLNENKVVDYIKNQSKEVIDNLKAKIQKVITTAKEEGGETLQMVKLLAKQKRGTKLTPQESKLVSDQGKDLLKMLATGLGAASGFGAIVSVLPATATIAALISAIKFLDLDDELLKYTDSSKDSARGLTSVEKDKTNFKDIGGVKYIKYDKVAPYLDQADAVAEAYSGFIRNPEDPDSEKFEPTGAVAEFREEIRALFGKFKGDLKNPEFIKGVAQIMNNWKPLLRSQLDEAKKKKEKKDPPLNKPKRGGSKAYYVYVRDPKTKKIKKVSFGSGGLRAKIRNPKARKAFAARHNCKNKKDRTKAGYWSCNLPRYAPALGLGAKMNTFW